MPDLLPELLPIPPLFHGIIMLVVVMAIKAGLQRLAPHEPWGFFSFFCRQLAAKVNKAENGTQQQTISGFISVLITFTPLWVILWLFADFVEVAFLWEGLLLYFALGNLTLKPRATKIATAITNSNNYLAKETLQPLVLRETQKLSAMGIAKATIEMLILRSLQQHITVAFIFLIGGGLPAISYRLLLEMHYAWNPKLPQLRAFGRFVGALVQLILWLPSRLILICGLILSFGQQSTLLWRLSLPVFFTLSSQPLVQFFALSMNIRLGGVAMYEGVKLRREESNSNGRQPEPKDIVHAYRFINRIYTLIAIGVVGIYLLAWVASLQV